MTLQTPIAQHLGTNWVAEYPGISPYFKISDTSHISFANLIARFYSFFNPTCKDTIVNIDLYLKDLEKIVEDVSLSSGNSLKMVPLPKSPFKKRGKSYSKFSIISSKEEEVFNENTDIVLSLTFEEEVATKYLQILRSAKRRGLPFNLTLSDVRKLLTRKTCYYTGVHFDTAIGNAHSRTIDRKNCEKGYVKGNVVACTLESNQFKEQVFEHKAMEYKSMLKMVKALMEIK